MLDFLLLGLVPGTNLEITFNEVLLSLLLADVAFYGYYKLRGPKVSPSPELELLRYQASLQLDYMGITPAGAPQRTILTHRAGTSFRPSYFPGRAVHRAVFGSEPGRYYRRPQAAFAV